MSVSSSTGGVPVILVSGRALLMRTPPSSDEGVQPLLTARNTAGARAVRRIKSLVILCKVNLPAFLLVSTCQPP